MPNPASYNHLSDSSEFFLIAISMLENEGKTNILPELMQVFTPKQIIILTQIFGGKTIRIPSTQDLSISLKAAIFVYQKTFLGQEFKDPLRELGVTEFEFERIQEKANSWYDCLKNKIGVGYYEAIKGST